MSKSSEGVTEGHLNQSLAAVVEEFNQPLVMRNIDIPVLTPSQVLVHLEVSGICHTDLHVIAGDWKAQAKLPIVPGHEGVGKVIKMGTQVTNLSIGQRVCIPWLHKSCEHCSYCQSNWQSLCLSQQQTGFSQNGTFQKYVIAESHFVCVVPPGITSEQAAPITCAGLTVYKALKVSGAKTGDFVAIIGAGGGLGHLAIQYAKHMQFKTIGIDVGKTDFMKSSGCDYSIDASHQDFQSQIMDITEIGVHAALCLAPSKLSMKQAVNYMRPNGTIVIVSLPSGDVQFNVFDIVTKGLKVVGSIVGSPQDLKEALDIAVSGKIWCNVETINFNQINSALNTLKSGSVEGRYVIRY